MRGPRRLTRPAAALLRAVALLVVLALGAGRAPADEAAAGAADAAADLYVARSFVTGQGEANRAAGFAQALREVVVKLTGDAGLAGDPRVAALAARAGGLVARFRYRDRMEGIPTHDEQGTRDRPYELTVAFDPARLDAALAALGRAPWPPPRPRLAVAIVVRTGAGAAVLAGDGPRLRDQREALLDVAARRGLPVLLPDAAAAARLDAAAGDLAALAAAARALGGAAQLAGTLAWSDAALGWTGTWQLFADGRIAAWSVGGVTFDEAFRDALGGAARILSGSGPPG